MYFAFCAYLDKRNGEQTKVKSSTVLFESKGKETLLDRTPLFDSEEMYNSIVKAYKAGEGQKQNLEKLEKYSAEMLNK